MSMSAIKNYLRRVYDTETGLLSSLLNLLIIFRDFLLECHFGKPFNLWTKSRVQWVCSSKWAAIRKAIIYVTPSGEKKILR